MKKAISLFLALVLAAMLAACGASSGAASSSAASSPASGAAPAESEAAPVQEEQPTAKAMSIEEQVLLEDAEVGVKVTAVSLEPTESGDALELKLLCENNSDQDYTFYANSFSLDSCVFYYGSEAAQVAGGKKANLAFYIHNTQLEAYGITACSKIFLDLVLHGANGETNYPLTVDVSDESDVPQAADFPGETVYDENGIVIKVCPILDDGMGMDEYYTLFTGLLVENQGTEPIEVFINDVSVNDFMCDYAYYGAYALKPGTYYYDNVYVGDDMLEDGTLQDTNTAEFSVTVRGAESHSNLATVSGITVEFTA